MKFKDKIKDLSYRHFPNKALEISHIFKEVESNAIDESLASPKSKIDYNGHLNNQNKNSFVNTKKEKENFMSTNLSSEINNINHNNNSNYNSHNEIMSNEEGEDLIKKIKSCTIFNDIKFVFNANPYEIFENNIKLLKQNYEDEIDSLERSMEYYKGILETYYRKKIQKTKSSFMDNIDLMSDNLPIMNITSEHNDKLRILRDLYDEKMKELEHVRKLN